MVNVINRKEMYLFERVYRYISIPMVKLLGKTSITPNMVTIINYILAALNCYFLFNDKFKFVSAILIIVYYFLDVVDGGLARYINKTSEFGRIMDIIGDGLFYSLFILGTGYNKVKLTTILILFLLHNFYGFMATYYIVPNIKKIKNFKRIGIKKYLMDKGVILGIDLSLLGILLTCAIVSGRYTFIYKLTIALYIVDILYRFIELWVNKYLDKNK